MKDRRPIWLTTLSSDIVTRPIDHTSGPSSADVSGWLAMYSACVCTCEHVRVYLCIRVCVCSCVCTGECVCACVCTCEHVHVYVCICVCVCSYVCMCVYVNVYTCMRVMRVCVCMRVMLYSELYHLHSLVLFVNYQIGKTNKNNYA